MLVTHHINRKNKYTLNLFFAFLIRYKSLNKFLNNLAECKVPYFKRITKNDLKTCLAHVKSCNFIFEAFDWSDTSEGNLYWNELNSEWRKIIHYTT